MIAIQTTSPMLLDREMRVDRREEREIQRLVKALTVLVGNVLILECGGDAG